MSELATLTVAGPIATLSLNRPDARNAMSIDLLAAARARVGELRGMRGVTVLIVIGSGKAFCAGMDLKAVATDEGLKAGLPLKLLSALAELTLELRSLPQVTVAKVNGAAIGGGCGLATVCDLAVTHADAVMGFPEVDLGVCPAVVAPWLVRKIGPGRARMVLLRGGTMPGRRAWELGIVDEVVGSAGELDAAVDGIAKRIAAGGPAALKATKELLNSLDGSVDPVMVRRGAEVSAAVLSTAEAQGMLRAKLGK